MATRLLENRWTLALVRLADELQSFVEWLKQFVLRVAAVLFHGCMSVNFEFFANVWVGIPSFGCVTLRHWVIVSHWIIDSPLTHWLTDSLLLTALSEPWSTPLQVFIHLFHSPFCLSVRCQPISSSQSSRHLSLPHPNFVPSACPYRYA
jgi:hypothetical protein